MSPPTTLASPAFVIAVDDRAPKLAAFASGTVACAARPVAANASDTTIASASAPTIVAVPDPAPPGGPQGPLGVPPPGPPCPPGVSYPRAPLRYCRRGC